MFWIIGWFLLGLLAVIIPVVESNLEEVTLQDLVVSLILFIIGPIGLFIVMNIFFHEYKNTVIWKNKKNKTNET